ncbi:hypothetical protein BOTBODRAFT_422259 [Botryobasidium botryosum FD-172 SS1]|uniref:DNA2/NAM7 helicase helicase domain-containing protein n=1 Tax=Botryobasidium botryosum (strain FD-172 SS1) TaxID=930990 RepID=A0A067MLB8_BOTB1|nr:hypothetical protein BOTBODRAFT_422259 [Botryobasidium botryosum FD-172 SS1]
MNRNEMAGYLFRRTKTKDEDKKDGLDEPEPFLPPTIDDDRACGRCYSSDGCMLYRKAVEGIEDDSSPISDFYERKTSHLTPTHTEFFKSWEALISSEEQEGLRFRKELWTLSAAAREKAGRCFADMIVLEHKQETGPRVTTFHRHTYKFTKRNPTWVTQDGTPTTLLNGQITEGDPVSVSIEPDLLALARGFVIKLTPHYVTVGVDHEVKVESTLARMQSASQHTGPTIFRIDKDELAGAMGKIRNNLARLFYADGDSKRLSLVVDLTPPVFDESDVLEGVALPPAFNPNQKEAMRKILSARDYALVLGMPGTGKTTTIAEIIKALVAKGKSVLLTSYTHSAVDTILLKLDDVKFKILRLGNEDRIHPDVLKHTLGYLNPATTIEQLEYQILVPPVVATTCLSVDQ